jgi:hypothetical protein
MLSEVVEGIKEIVRIKIRGIKKWIFSAVW